MTTTSKHWIGIIAAPVLVAALAACNKPAQLPEAPADESAKTPVAQIAEPAAVGIDKPLTRDQVSVKLEQVGEVKYDAATDELLIRVKLQNNGQTPLITAGKLPVKLGVQLVGEDGNPDKAPGNREFARVPLPMIAPGQSVEVDARIPAKPTVGLRLRVLPLQEGVAWFDKLGQHALLIGPMGNCSNGSVGICQ